jgi:hypothetical protein
MRSHPTPPRPDRPFVVSVRLASGAHLTTVIYAPTAWEAENLERTPLIAGARVVALVTRAALPR